ncbi:MAG: DUF2953 domain-containing protein [Firmicutes bacterium]|nr:DUF2953 domain-containing protein [Dethiobacter sp.]MBS3889346.1 DUF2953 domain-containing protein [Bacillota bacterium]MBS4055324.1 DUF2953 domain-containing protein [Thermaerobacter sp.]
MELQILAIMLVVLGVVALLLAKAEVELKYERKGSDDRVTIRMLGPYGVVFQRTEVSVVDLGPTLESLRLEVQVTTKEEVGDAPVVDYRMEADISDSQKLLRLARAVQGLVQDYRRVIQYAERRTKLRSLSWQTAIGTGDAASTAILCGMLWGLKGMLLGSLQSRLTIEDKNMTIAVFPSFNERKFQTFLHCILSLRVVHIIGAGYILWKEKRKRKKRGERSGKSSNPRADEDSHGKHSGHGRRQHHCW